MNIMLRRGLRKYHGLLEHVERMLLDEENGDQVETELKRFCRKEPCWARKLEKVAKQVKIKIKTIVTDLAVIPDTVMKAIVTGIAVPETTGCKTADCFTDSSVFAYRDSDLDRWLTSNLPATPAGCAINFQLIKSGMTLREMAKTVLATDADDVNEIGRQLIATGKTWSPKQVNDLVIRYEKREKSLNLRDDGWANLFPVHDEKMESVFVLFVFRFSVRWHVRVSRLGYVNEWSAEGRFFPRN